MDGLKSVRRPQTQLGGPRPDSKKHADVYGETLELGVFPGAFSPRHVLNYQRPSTAAYMSPRSQFRLDRPISRTPEAKISSRVHKMERYREEGVTRWPPLAENSILQKPHQFERKEEQLPLRRGVQNQDKNPPAELWRRSLRTPGVPIADDVYETIAGTVQLLHKEWAAAPLSPRGEKPLGFTGRTTGSRFAAKRSKNNSDWVMRPVSFGQFALEHHDGKRYAFDRKA